MDQVATWSYPNDSCTEDANDRTSLSSASDYAGSFASFLTSEATPRRRCRPQSNHVDQRPCCRLHPAAQRPDQREQPSTTSRGRFFVIFTPSQVNLQRCRSPLATPGCCRRPPRPPLAAQHSGLPLAAHGSSLAVQPPPHRPPPVHQRSQRVSQCKKIILPSD